MKVYIGTSGWTYEHWKDLFYPEGLARSRWFEHYSTCFPAVEVNATFYRSFKEQTFQKWRDKAPSGFKYVLKVPRLVTHRKYLKDVDETIGQFVRVSAVMGDTLGAFLLQLAPGMPFEPDRLRRALRAFPQPDRVAVEFRHQRWFTDEIRELLSEIGAIFCIVDSPMLQVRDWVTSSVVYFRMHGRSRWYAHNYSPAELSEVAQRILALESRSVDTVYVFFNNDYQGYAPRNAALLMDILGELGAKVSGVHVISPKT